MSTQTSNYKLTKPATTDKYNVTIFNANADIIDTQMKANADAAGSKQPKITGAATTITDANLTVSRALVSNGTGKVAVSEITSTELGYLDGVTSGIQGQLDGKLPIEGTATKATADASGNTITTTYATKSEVNTAVNGINEAIDGINEELDTKVPNTLTVNGKALTGNISLGASDVGALPASGTAVKATADANGDNIANTYAKKSEIPASVTVESALSSTSTNPVQNKVVTEALDDKQPTITGAATSITTSNLTASRALVSDASGKVAVSEITSTELGYLDGVTSAIQTQINNVKSTADTAKSTADTAKTNAATAQSTADSALTTANTAKTNASTAQSTADGKQDPIVAGTGIAIADDGVTINHSNSVSAQTSYVGSATAIPRFKFDAQGHITSVTTTTVYPPTTAGTAGQVWTSDGSGAGKWAEPSGGEVWEEVDLANFPTDWVEGDRVKIRFSVQAYVAYNSQPSSWTTKPTVITPSWIASDTPSRAIIEFKVGSEEDTTSTMPVAVNLFPYNSIAITTAVVLGFTAMNSGNVIRLDSCVFNGAGSYAESYTVDSANLTKYVKQMWRLKQ